MSNINRARVFWMATALVVCTASPAKAQIRTVEVGGSLTLATVGFDDGRTLGMQEVEFGSLKPGVFASVFLTPKLAIEPQFRTLAISGRVSCCARTANLTSFAGQVSYFLRGSPEDSPYVFGGVGIVSVVGSSYGSGSEWGEWFGGTGYRTVLGRRVAVRVDGRFTHFTRGGDTFAITMSLGGVFGK